MIKLDFESTDYAEDFEALVDANQVFDWMPEYGYVVWFKAYDTSCRESEYEIELNDNGYAYDCCVHVLDDMGAPVINWIKTRAVKSREEAEETLYKMAEDIAKDKDVVEHLRKVVDVVKSAADGMEV